MNEIDLAEIMARANGATPGPWCVGHEDGLLTVDQTPDANDSKNICVVGSPRLDSTIPGDALFIAHARADVPALLSALENSLKETMRLSEEKRAVTAERGAALTREIKYVDTIAQLRAERDEQVNAADELERLRPEFEALQKSQERELDLIGKYLMERDAARDELEQARGQRDALASALDKTRQHCDEWQVDYNSLSETASDLMDRLVRTFPGTMLAFAIENEDAYRAWTRLALLTETCPDCRAPLYPAGYVGGFWCDVCQKTYDLLSAVTAPETPAETPAP